MPGTIGSRSITSPASPIVYVYASSIRSSRTSTSVSTNATSPTPSHVTCSTARSGLQPPDHREPERGQERGGGQQARDLRDERTVRTTNHAPMNPAAISEPYSSMLGGTRPCLPSPTNAYAPMPGDERQEQQPDAVGGARRPLGRGGPAHGARAPLPLRSLRICSTIAERLRAIVRRDPVGERRVLRQLRDVRDRDVGLELHVREVKSADRRRDPLEHGDVAVGLADVPLPIEVDTNGEEDRERRDDDDAGSDRPLLDGRR